MPQAHGSVRTTLATGQLLFPPGQPHPGVEPADPMLVLRNTAYPISLGERQYRRGLFCGDTLALGNEYGGVGASSNAEAAASS